MTELEHAGTTYHLIGTAHVSKASVDEVQRAIAELRPDVVCVELCKARLDALTGERPYRDLDLVKVLREGRGMFLLAQLGLSAYQRRLGKRLGVKPGAELLAAVATAKELGIEVQLIDRDVGITLRRTWANLGVAKRAMLGASLLIGAIKSGEITEAAVEELKEKRQLSELLAELAEVMTEIKGPLIDERDAYLASKLRDAGAGKRRVIAVVGAAHVPGMTEQLGREIDRAALEQLPPVRRRLRWLGPVVLTALMIAGWRAGAPLPAVLLAWLVPTTIGAALATLVAGGSLGGIAMAALVAPLGTLVPSIGTAKHVGVAEARWRRPTTADRDRLGEDTTTVRGFLTNRITRILVISVASAVGMRLGLWIACIKLATFL